MGKIWKRLFTKDDDPLDAMPAYPTDGETAVATPAQREKVAPFASTESKAASGRAFPGTDMEDRFYRFVLSMPDTPQKEMSAAETAMLRRLTNICGEDRFDISRLPRMPEVLPQLLRLLKNDDADGTKLAKLIGRDPVLVGEVMRVSKSAHYRTLQPITSLQHAIVLIGQDVLRRTVTQHVMKPILQASAGMLGHAAGHRLWHHAERCSHTCMFLAKGKSDLFEAYLSGIVCNVGVGALIRVLDQEVPPELRVFSRTFLAKCIAIGNHLSLRAAQSWDMAPNVVKALQERLLPIEAEASTSLHLSNLLSVADHLAMMHLLIEHHQLPETTPYPADQRAGLPESLIELAQQDLQRNFQSQTL